MVLHYRGGIYNDLFHYSGAFGPDLGTEPNTGNAWGPGSSLANTALSRDKAVKTIRKMKQDMPWIRGIFLDDYGSHWSGYRTADQYARARVHWGTVFDALLDVGAELGLIFFVNGMWDAPGWPDTARPGLHGAIPVWEHHRASHDAYAATQFGSGSQYLHDEQGVSGCLNIAFSGDYGAALQEIGNAHYAQIPLADRYSSAGQAIMAAEHPIEEPRGWSLEEMAEHPDHELEQNRSSAWVVFWTAQSSYDAPGPVVGTKHDIGVHWDGVTPPQPPPPDPPPPVVEVTPKSFTLTTERAADGGLIVRGRVETDHKDVPLIIARRKYPWGQELCWRYGLEHSLRWGSPPALPSQGVVTFRDHLLPGRQACYRAFHYPGGMPDCTGSHTTGIECGYLDSTPAKVGA